MCTAIAIGLLVAMARRVGGKWAAIAASAALLAAIPSLPYWLSITKTYALEPACSSPRSCSRSPRPIRPGIRLPLAAALAVGFAATRTSGVGLAVLLIAALVVRAPDEEDARAVRHSRRPPPSRPSSALVLLEWTRAKWGLFDYHQLEPSKAKGIGKFFSRTFGAAEAWPGPFLLGIGRADRRAASIPRCGPGMKRRLDLVAVAAGIVVFLLLHEAGGAFFSEEYLAPLIAPCSSSRSCVLVHAATRSAGTERRRAFRRAEQCRSLSASSSPRLTGGHSDYLGRPGWKGDPAGEQVVARACRSTRSRATRSSRFSLEEVVVEAHRRAANNVTLGQFSYQDVSTKRARS